MISAAARTRRVSSAKANVHRPVRNILEFIGNNSLKVATYLILTLLNQVVSMSGAYDREQ